LRAAGAVRGTLLLQCVAPGTTLSRYTHPRGAVHRYARIFWGQQPWASRTGFRASTDNASGSISSLWSNQSPDCWISMSATPVPDRLLAREHRITLKGESCARSAPGPPKKETPTPPTTEPKTYTANDVTSHNASRRLRSRTRRSRSPEYAPSLTFKDRSCVSQQTLNPSADPSSQSGERQADSSLSIFLRWRLRPPSKLPRCGESQRGIEVKKVPFAGAQNLVEAG